MSETLEAPGTPPAWAFDPRAGVAMDMLEQQEAGPAISAKFFMGPDPRKDPHGSDIINAEGQIPIIEMVEITNRNDLKNSPSINISTDIHRYKWFPKEYNAFRQGVAVQMTGTPLREWLGENARTQNLASFHIHTVEQLAAASDSLCQTLGPGTYDLVTRAKAYLTAHKQTDAAEKAIAENVTLNRRLEEMSAQIARLTAQHESSEAKGTPDALETHPAEVDPLAPTVADMAPDSPPRPRMGRPPNISKGL